MANPTVDKLKAFGLRHGEKVAMGAVALIFAFCAYSAWSHPSLDLTADEVSKTAKDALAKLNAQQKPETIVAKLDELNIKPMDFEKKVDALQAGTVDASQYKLVRPFVLPEPGAGLIRDMPQLLAPVNLAVHSGRGAVRILELDEDGHPIRKTEASEKTPRRPRAKRQPRGGMGMGMLGGGMGGRTGKSKRNSGASADAEKKKDEEEAQKRKEKAFARDDDATKKDEEKPADEEPEIKAEDAETTLQGYRFVTLVGKFNHKQQKELYARALKEDGASAAPHYLRLDVERQKRNADGSWGDWASINRSKYDEVKGLLTKTEDEVVPPEKRIAALVDMLPFLEIGYWVGTAPLSLVPKDIAKPKKADDSKMAAAGGIGGKGGSRMGGGNQFSAADYAKMGKGAGAQYGANGGGMGGAGFDPSMLGKSGAGGAGGPKNPDAGEFDKSDADWLMVRALDFDVEPDAQYRYRARIVVANPNKGWSTVAPGVDTRVEELKGPWSDITPDVDVPPDVSTYAMRKAPAGADSTGEKTEFQVVAWNEADGLTVVHTFTEAPGQIIGTRQNVYLPDLANEKDKKPKSKDVDFTSRQILADATGGERPTAEIRNFGSSRLDVPVVALVVRNDGVLVLRDQAKDAASGEREELKAIYDKIMEDAKSGGKKENSTLSGAYGGGMGGGYGGSAGGMGGVRGAN